MHPFPNLFGLNLTEYMTHRTLNIHAASLVWMYRKTDEEFSYLGTRDTRIVQVRETPKEIWNVFWEKRKESRWSYPLNMVQAFEGPIGPWHLLALDTVRRVEAHGEQTRIRQEFGDSTRLIITNEPIDKFLYRCALAQDFVNT